MKDRTTKQIKEKHLKSQKAIQELKKELIELGLKIEQWKIDVTRIVEGEQA